MILEFLPFNILSQLNGININSITEIRLRTGYCINALIDGQRVFFNKGKIISVDDIKTIISNITENSLYAYNENLKKGFLTTKDGVRVGVAGECVFEGNKILTIKNVNSLNIRIPHLIRDCAQKYIEYMLKEESVVYNSLIVAPPSYGKTTLLKDISLILNEKIDKQILIIDERGEFSEVKGKNIDKICYSDKLYAFNYGLRSLSPSIVITDELLDQNDWNCIKDAVNSGVKIIASCHGERIEDVKNKRYFLDNLFERYFTIDTSLGVGVLKHCYDSNFKVI